jgi:hypothetical protein
MATEPMSEVYAPPSEHETEQSPRPDSGSVWWAELAFGGACSLTAVGFALAHTAVGPFSAVTIVYPTVVSVAYLVLASVLALVFVRSGLRRAASFDGHDGDGPVESTDPDVLETVNATGGSDEDR